MDNQLRNARQAAAAVQQLVEAGFRVCVTHGNGPQVGLLALQDPSVRATQPEDISWPRRGTPWQEPLAAMRWRSCVKDSWLRWRSCAAAAITALCHEVFEARRSGTCAHATPLASLCRPGWMCWMPRRRGSWGLCWSWSWATR